MMGLSPLELTVIALLIVVLFGAKRLPELGSGIGKAISNFKKGYKEAQEIDVTPPSPEQKNNNQEPKGGSAS